ncbi:MAG: TatD family hydrolase [Phycisphaerae bacterium]
MRLIDTHCHLTHGRLAGDIAGVLDRARQAGVAACVCAAGELDEAAKAQALAARTDAMPIYFTAGVHPHDAKNAPADLLARLEGFLADRRCVAVGEIGLDYHYDFSPREVQRRVFAEQLDLARRLGKAAVIHTREAFADTMAVLRDSAIDGGLVVFHSCTEPPANARAALDFGATIGFSGILTFKKAKNVQESARLVPDDRLLVETDAPYLSPEPVRSMKNNEPANVAHVARFLAALRGTSDEALAELTTANACRFFGLKLGS